MSSQNPLNNDPRAAQPKPVHDGREPPPAEEVEPAG
jgi:hypothetical protein